MKGLSSQSSLQSDTVLNTLFTSNLLGLSQHPSFSTSLVIRAKVWGRVRRGCEALARDGRDAVKVRPPLSGTESRHPLLRNLGQTRSALRVRVLISKEGW